MWCLHYEYYYIHTNGVCVTMYSDFIALGILQRIILFWEGGGGLYVLYVADSVYLACMIYHRGNRRPNYNKQAKVNWKQLFIFGFAVEMSSEISLGLPKMIKLNIPFWFKYKGAMKHTVNYMIIDTRRNWYSRSPTQIIEWVSFDNFRMRKFMFAL